MFNGFSVFSSNGFSGSSSNGFSGVSSKFDEARRGRHGHGQLNVLFRRLEEEEAIEEVARQLYG